MCLTSIASMHFNPISAPILIQSAAFESVSHNVILVILFKWFVRIKEYGIKKVRNLLARIRVNFTISYSAQTRKHSTNGTNKFRIMQIKWAIFLKFRTIQKKKIRQEIHNTSRLYPIWIRTIQCSGSYQGTPNHFVDIWPQIYTEIRSV